MIGGHYRTDTTTRSLWIWDISTRVHPHQVVMFDPTERCWYVGVRRRYVSCEYSGTRLPLHLVLYLCTRCGEIAELRGTLPSRTSI